MTTVQALRSLSVLALGVLLLGKAEAQFNYSDYDSRDLYRDTFGHDHGSRHGDSLDRERLVEIIDRDFRGQNTLPLRQILDVGPEYRGMKVKKVFVVASSRAGFGQIALEVNGMKQGYAQTAPRHEEKMVFELDHRDIVLGQTARSIQLELEGNIHIQKVGMILEEDDHRGGHGPGHGRRDEVITEHVGQYFSKYSNLKVGQELKLRDLSGLELKEIELDVQELTRSYGATTASLIVNGQVVDTEMISRSGRYGTSTVRFNLGRRSATIGEDIRMVQVAFSDDVYVSTLKATVSKGHVRPGPGPRPVPVQRVIKENVYKSVFGEADLKLSQLVRTSRFQELMEVSSVELTIRNRDLRAGVKLCEGYVIRNSGQCSNAQRLQTGLNRVVLTPASLMKLQDAQIVLRGDLVIEEVTIRLR